MSFVKPTIVFSVALGVSATAAAMENAKVLPKGVRNLDLRSVNTSLDSKTDGSGRPQPLAEPLMQQVTFAKISQSEPLLKKKQLASFLTTHDFTESDVVGEFKADLRGQLGVVAGIGSWGVTDRLTVAVGVPYYRARTSLEVGFVPNATAQRFLDALARPENNQIASAQEAGDKLNNAVAKLNAKLADNGYRSLEDWEGVGLGDVTVAAKYLAYQGSAVQVATTSGLVAATGRVDDPDILNDIAFGDGQWDMFGQVAVDEPLGLGLVANQFAKYTVQLPSERRVRAVTADESIEVAKERTRFKLGDKLDLGTSVRYEPTFGLVAGLGYNYFRKYGDVYRDLPLATKTKLEGATDQEAHNGEVALGYSTVPAFQRGDVAVPLELKLTYVRQLQSRNMPVSDLAQFDLNLFF